VATRVLIVHDDADLVDRLRASIAASAPSVEIVNALSGPRAQGMMSQAMPDVLVVDAELLGIDGYEFTKQVKANAASKDVPVIIISLAADEASALRARQVGASALLASNGPIENLSGRILALASAGAVAPASPAAPSPIPPGPAPVAGYGAPQPVSAAPSAPAPVGQPASYGAPQPVSANPMADVSVTSSGNAPGADTPHIDDLLRIMLDRGGSDLHITVGSPPGIRQRGELVPIENMKPLMPRDTMEMILSLLSEEQRRRFETELELDFAYSIPGVSRFRANVLQQRNSMGAVFRVIPIKIPTMDELALPKVCQYLAERPRGLVLVTGPTGSGKSTTLAAMINHINETRPVHIITMEDPIEFMHRNKKAYVNQREVGEDTHSFASALKRVLRQDPDVILVGEMRDLETISAAITAAETGHLVLATLHTTGGPETIDRVIDVFPPHQQQQVRMQLSSTLEGVLSQVLLRSNDGRSRIMAMEIMLGIPAISNLIREGKTHQMETIIQGGASLGMQTLDQHLKNLLTAGKVTFEEAISKAKSPRELAAMMGRKI